MGVERREFERVRVNFRARWSSNVASREALVTDLSAGGCFVFSSISVEVGTLLRIELVLPKGGDLTLWGHVVRIVEEIGFGVRFARFIQQDDRRKLDWLIKAEAHKRRY